MKLKDDNLAGLEESEGSAFDRWAEEFVDSEESQELDPNDASQMSWDDDQQATQEPTAASAAVGSDTETQLATSEPQRPPGTAPESAPTAPEDPTAVTEKRTRRAPPVKLAIVGLLAVLMLAVVSFVGMEWYKHGHQPHHLLQEIRHPIPSQRYRQQFNFFILANSAQGKALIKLGLVFEFYALNAYQEFQKADLTEKDLIFGFLQGAHPNENSWACWQQIVRKQLLAYLRRRLPHNGIESIRITHLNSL